MGTQPRKTRGVVERPPDSGMWWINYYVNGKQHRERVGRKSDAIALYQKRNADARRGVKLRELQPQKVTIFWGTRKFRCGLCQSPSENLGRLRLEGTCPA
jgi:hypothetical protein